MLKDQVLAALLGSEGFVSGEVISRDLRVSRMAVSNAVKALRAEGFEIESATNRGYRLLSSPDRITAGSLQAVLGKKRMERVLCFESTDSTNRRLQEAVLDRPDVPHGLAAVANEQTAGRGRLGRSFSSPRNMGVYLSYLICPKAPFSSEALAPWTAVTSWTAVAVCRAIENTCGVRPDIKWVNDLYLNGKKICGILTQMDLESESGSIRDIIIGIGVNVQETADDFPEELRGTAGSLYQETGRMTDRSVLAAEMIRQLDRMCEDWPDASGTYLEEYRKSSLVTGREIRVITSRGAEDAVAEGIGDDFSLLVRYPDGHTGALRGGEISIRLQQ